MAYSRKRKFEWTEYRTVEEARQSAIQLSKMIKETIFFVVVVPVCSPDNERMTNADRPKRIFVGEAWAVGFYRYAIEGYFRGKPILL